MHYIYGINAVGEALKARGVRKRWILVQTRTDIVCRHPELLEAWRPLAKDFDIFFGLEAASDAGLAGVVKTNPQHAWTSRMRKASQRPGT
jgi:hypothetical protein